MAPLVTNPIITHNYFVAHGGKMQMQLHGIRRCRKEDAASLEAFHDILGGTLYAY